MSLGRARTAPRSTVALVFATALGAAPAAVAAPDISGWWQAEPPFVINTMPFEPPPLKPAAAAKFKAAAQAIAAGATPAYCRPHKFTGFSYGVGADIEILLTPGRATLIANEIRLVRRIYIDAAMPADPLPTDAGASIGRWEGDVLVVRTVGLDPTAPYPSAQPGAPLLGSDAEVVERIRMPDKDTLVFEFEVNAPEIMTKPDHRRQVYRRVLKDIDYAMTLCDAQDRSVGADGRQQFDMTPPKDLPPPPPG